VFEKEAIMEDKLTLSVVRKNAKRAALRDGYNQFVLLENDGTYGFTREYPGCVPEWWKATVVERIVVRWRNGILTVYREVIV
jgi:hypothetical protein